MADNLHNNTVSVMQKKLISMNNEIINRQLDKRKIISNPENKIDGTDSPCQTKLPDVTVELLEKDNKKLRSIETALLMISKGTYGICQGCNNPIPLPRLEIIPNAIFCIECQSANEENRSTQRR